MSKAPWTDEENDLIVADYFAMLADDLSGRSYNTAEHRRALVPLLNGRSEGAVEFKHQNSRAVLKGPGEEWTAIYDYLLQHNTRPKPFTWGKTAENILARE